MSYESVAITIIGIGGFYPNIPGCDFLQLLETFHKNLTYSLINNEYNVFIFFTKSETSIQMMTDLFNYLNLW